MKIKKSKRRRRRKKNKKKKRKNQRTWASPWGELRANPFVSQDKQSMIQQLEREDKRSSGLFIVRKKGETFLTEERDNE